MIYFDDIKKNIIALKEFGNINFPIYNIILCDIETGKILSRIQFPKDFKNEIYYIKFFLLENKYFIIYNRNSILIYLYIFEKKTNSLHFEHLNTIPNIYKAIFKLKDILILRNKEKNLLVFSKINQKYNLEEIFTLDFISEYKIDIEDINNNKILIKHFKLENIKDIYYKVEIYNIKIRQKISIFNLGNNTYNVLSFKKKYMIVIKSNNFIIYN